MNNNIGLLIFILFSCQSSFAQIDLDRNVLRVRNYDDMNLMPYYEYLDGIRAIVFDGSEIKSLDTIWSHMINVESITFMNGAIIPKGLELIPGDQEYRFSSYFHQMKAPVNFPFNSIRTINFSDVDYLPDWIHKCDSIAEIYLYMCRDVCYLNKCSRISSLKYFHVSESTSTSIDAMNRMSGLMELSFSYCKFSSSVMDLTELTALKNLSLHHTNIGTLILPKHELEIVEIIDCQIPMHEIQRMVSVYKSKIWRADE